MTAFQYQRLAAAELRDIYRRYQGVEPAVAFRFLDAVDDAVNRMQADPSSHPVEHAHCRWVKVRNFPYRLIFEQIGSQPILILAVAHDSRRPRYWHKRR